MKIYFLTQKRTLQQFFIAIFFISNVLFLQTAHGTKQQPLPLQQPTTSDIYTSIVMCPSCGFFFDNLTEMHYHFFNQHTDQQTICHYCGDISISQGWLNEHIKIHTTQGQFVQTESVDQNLLIMPQNNASIENSGINIIFVPTIIIYENQKPDQPKKHVCLTCNKSFVRKNDLITHQRSHTGQRPFQCPLCSKKFTTSSNLWRHLKCKGHIFKTLQKCTHCPLEFSDASSLYLHLQCDHGYKLNPLQNTRPYTKKAK